MDVRDCSHAKSMLDLILCRQGEKKTQQLFTQRNPKVCKLKLKFLLMKIVTTQLFNDVYMVYS